MSTELADDIRRKLKNAIKNGKTSCGEIASHITKIIDEALWQHLTLPEAGESPADKFHALITHPYDKGGLNCEIWQIDALLGLSPSVQLKFRNLIHQASQGARNDLVEEKVEVEIPEAKSNSDPSDTPKPKKKPKKKPPGQSDSQKAKDRAVSRAAEAIPQVDELLDNKLVNKEDLVKIGGKVKDPENPTEKEQEILKQQKQVKEKLAEIVPNPLPEDPEEQKKLKQKVKKVIENTTGKVTPPKVALDPDPQEAAKKIAKAGYDLDYLQQLLVALEFAIEDLQNGETQTA